MVERVPLLRPAGTTTEEDPPGVVDLAQTSTELFEVWAPVQVPLCIEVNEHPDAANAGMATVALIKLVSSAAALVSRSLYRSTFRFLK